MISMFGTYGWTTTVNPRPVIESDLISGVGRGKLRGPDKTERYHQHKKKTARKMAKQSRRRNRR